jgi:RNA 3'-terminal phosphate cyclase (ATP)
MENQLANTNSSPVWIDGSQGEGGGQIVRTALALSLLTGRPCVLEKIRAGRRKPGLKQQHLTAVHAAAEISRAHVTDARLGSSRLEFTPGTVLPGDYGFRVGTAGSATLVLQTILPALLIAPGDSSLHLEGGTHNPWAPPFDFLARAYVPLINRMGPQVSVTLDRPGFYPAGGGEFRATVETSRSLRGFDLVERGALRRRTVRALLSRLPRHIGEREVDAVCRKLNWPAETGHVEIRDGAGPGNVVLVEVEFEQLTEVFIAFGRVGVRAEEVAREVARSAQNYLKMDVPVGPYLADQLLLPLAISAACSGDGGGKRGGTFRTGHLTQHATTQIEVIPKFLDVAIEVQQQNSGEETLVKVSQSRGGM